MRAFWASVCDCVCVKHPNKCTNTTLKRHWALVVRNCNRLVLLVAMWYHFVCNGHLRLLFQTAGGKKTSWCHLIVSSCFACMWGSVPDTPLISLFISSLCECASVCVCDQIAKEAKEYEKNRNVQCSSWKHDTCSAKGNGEANKYLPPTSHLKIFKSTAGIQLAKENLQFGLIAPIREVKAEAYLARTLALCQHEAKLTYWISNVATFLTHRGTQHTELSFLADDKALQEYQEGTDCFCAEQPAWSKFLARGISYYSISLHIYIYT